MRRGASENTAALSREPRNVQKIDQQLLDLVEELVGGKGRIRLLEAGCGARSYFRFRGEVEAFGIDISAEELSKNANLQHKILGDIQTHDLPRNYFDVVICWDVLEHLSQPRLALENMFSSLKPNGVLILGFPNPMSFKGIVTKLTPAWVHALFYRQLFGYTSTAFRTYMRHAILPKRIGQFARQHGMVQEYLRLEEGRIQRSVRDRFAVLGALLSLIQFCVRLFTFGRGPCLYLDSCTMILRRKGDKPLP